MNKKTVYVVYSNTDLTEGRGHQYPIATCTSYTTAKRISKGRYVQGSDGPIKPTEMYYEDGKWFIEAGAVYIQNPSEEDLKEDKKRAELDSIIEKAKLAGLTEEDIKKLRGNP
jgi:hypothetical protein